MGIAVAGVYMLTIFAGIVIVYACLPKKKKIELMELIVNLGE